jgi:hypothetical protein
MVICNILAIDQCIDHYLHYRLFLISAVEQVFCPCLRLAQARRQVCIQHLIFVDVSHSKRLTVYLLYIVISVDNSAIIEKARANVKENGLDGIITYVSGSLYDTERKVHY